MAACPHRKRVGVSSLEHGLAHRIGFEVVNHPKKVENETGALDEHNLKTNLKTLKRKRQKGAFCIHAPGLYSP